MKKLFIAVLFIFSVDSFCQPYCDFLYVDTLGVEINANTVNITDYKLCGYCNSVFAVSIRQSADSIFITQTDTVYDKTTCSCLFNLTTTIGGLLPGEYTAIVYREKLIKYGYPNDNLEFVGSVDFTIQQSPGNLDLDNSPSSILSDPSELIYLDNSQSSCLSDPVELIYPQDGSFVEYSGFHSQYLIRWWGLPRNAVNISYSLDNGITWLTALINPYLSENYSASWILPDTLNVKCMIRVSASDDSLNYDRNNVPFTIYRPEYNFISTNEIYMKLSSNGVGSFDPLTDAGGLYWPGGLDGSISATYEDGLWWSGMVNGEKLANGSQAVRSGSRGGVILNDGSPADPTDSLYRIWKISRNWESLPPGPEKDNFEFNYNNWPAEIGAPWTDVNEDGVFTRGIDEPKHIGDETLWYVSNDADTPKCLSVFGSPPLGIEFHVTTWAYNSEELKDVVFKKYQMINKGSNTIDDFILGFRSDDDLGDAGDDYPGCDPSLNLGYIFNGDNNDGMYGDAPPAIGRMIIQGPIIPGAESDSGRYGDGWRKGYKNLRMSAYSPGFKSPVFLPADPPIGRYQGTLEVFNLLRGLKNDGDSLIDPHTGLGTIFPLPGDPETGTGWYCGAGWTGGPTPGDRRSLIPSGPFTLSPGDTNEIVIAVFLKRGTSNLNSVTKLKEYAAYLQNWYNVNMVSNVENADQFQPGEFSLSQNYPNPFNPVTNIRYSLSGRQNVQIKIFDVIGNEITTLINKEQAEGKYNIRFDASGLASGIYFYTLKAGGFSETKKMVLMK